MENYDSPRELYFTDQIRSFLKTTYYWSRIIGVFLFIIAGLILLLGLFMLFGMGSFSEVEGIDSLVYFPFLGVIYIIIAALYIPPALYLLRFTHRGKAALEHHDEMAMSESFLNLMKYSRFVGILIVVVVGLTLILFLLGIIFTAFAI